MIVHGAHDLIQDTHELVYAFTRSRKNDRLLVVLNSSAERPVFASPGDLDFQGNELLN